MIRPLRGSSGRLSPTPSKAVPTRGGGRFLSASDRCLVIALGARGNQAKTKGRLCVRSRQDISEPSLFSSRRATMTQSTQYVHFCFLFFFFSRTPFLSTCFCGVVIHRRRNAANGGLGVTQPRENSGLYLCCIQSTLIFSMLHLRFREQVARRGRGSRSADCAA